MAKDAGRKMEVFNGSSRPTLSPSTSPRRADFPIVPETLCGHGADNQDCTLSESASHLNNS